MEKTANSHPIEVSDDDSFRVYCAACDERISREEFPTAVMVKVWDADLNRYIGEGPFHAKCARGLTPYACRKAPPGGA